MSQGKPTDPLPLGFFVSKYEHTQQFSVIPYPFKILTSNLLYQSIISCGRNAAPLTIAPALDQPSDFLILFFTIFEIIGIFKSVLSFFCDIFSKTFSLNLL